VLNYSKAFARKTRLLLMFSVSMEWLFSGSVFLLFC
jgi:hypothetical protein